MAPIRLTCLMGTECTFKTHELEMEVSRDMLYMHMRYAHSRGAAAAGYC